MSKGLTGEITKLKDKFNTQADEGQYTVEDLKEVKETLQNFITEVETAMFLQCL